MIAAGGRGNTNPNEAPSDLPARVAALEMSEELREIYSHPDWIKFVKLLENVNSKRSRNTLRQWAESNHQLRPMIAWFHRCTEKYGLSFDIYNFIPPSRLILQDQCQEKIRIYKVLAFEHLQQLKYYEDLHQLLQSDPTKFSDEVEDLTLSCKDSCWSVLTEKSCGSVYDEGSSRSAGKPGAIDQSAPTSPIEPFLLPPVAAARIPHAYYEC